MTKRGDPRPEDEVREELEAHFEGTVELLMERGWSEERARAEAHRRFGDLDRYRRALERRARRRAWRDRVDLVVSGGGTALRSALREIRSSPGLSAAVVIVLLLGIGANGAIFRIVDRLLLSPPPHVAEPTEVVRLHQTLRRDGADPWTIDAFSYRDVEVARDASTGARFAAAMLFVPETLGEGEGATRLRVARVDTAYFPLLGVGPARGRGLVAEDHGPGAAPVAVLGFDLWRTRFGGDPSILGRRLRIARGEYEVVGIMPEGFSGAQAPATEAWIPLEPDAAGRWGEGWTGDPRVMAFRVLSRLPARVDRTSWTSRLEEVLRGARAADEQPMELLDLSTSSLVPGTGPQRGEIVAVSRWLTAVSLLLLVIACANAATLFLVQGERQRRAVAVRMALGAGARQIRVTILARSLILALVGAAGACLVAVVGGDLLERFFLEGLELPTRPATSRLLLLVGALAVLASLLSGLLPALGAPHVDLRKALEAGGRSTTGSGALRRTLVAVQVGLSAILLVGAGLFVASFRSASTLDLGFDHERLVMVRLEPDDNVETSRSSLYRSAEERVTGVPAVERSSATIEVPFVLLYGLSATVAGEEPLEDRVVVNAVGAEYFRTMGVEIIRGRPIGPPDLVEGAEPVAVIGHEAAARLWPGGNALGRCLRIGAEEGSPCTRVVGVAREHARGGFAPSQLSAPTLLQAWVSLAHPASGQPAALLVRVTTSPGRSVPEIRRAALSVPGVRYAEVDPMTSFVDREMQSWRIGATVFSLFGLLALVVAAVGLHAVLTFEVAQRRRELGIRLALGARRIQAMVPVLSAGWPMVAAGLMAGLALAAWGATRLGPLLFRTSPHDPGIFAGAAAVLLLTALASLAIPAWRAGGVDPRETLAEE